MSALCRMGFHGKLVTGLGMMGDAIICLRCGREKYEEHWFPWQVARAVQFTPELQNQVETARNLPEGSNTLALRPDPEFDRWFNSPLKDGSLPPWAK